MAKRTGPTNEHLQNLIRDLRKQSSEQKVGIWKRIAQDLEKPTRQRRAVNLYSLNLNTKDNETIIVPGKVLGTGEIDKSITVAAFSFSENAKQRIQSAKGKCITIHELLKNNPKGKDVRIMG